MSVTKHEMVAKVVFVVGACQVLGAGEGVAVRRLSKKQLAAAKVVLDMGLSHDEWDALEEQLCHERNWKQQMAAERRECVARRNEALASEVFRAEFAKRFKDRQDGRGQPADKDMDVMIDSLNAAIPAAPQGWDRV